jgi:hypothetical protein
VTKEQFAARYQQLLDDPDFMDFFNRYARKILLSGAIDLEAYENDYRLPKIVLCSALKEASFQYTPLSKDDKKTLKNLEYF